MKKFYSFLALMLMCVSIQAQSWVIQPEGDYPWSTVVYAHLTTNLSSSNLIIGAFVNGECKTAVAAEAAPTGAPLYTFYIQSGLDADLNQEITFKLYDGETGYEYPLKSPTKMTFTEGGIYGNPPSTNAIELSLTAAESYRLAFYEAEAGQEYNLLKYLTVTPAGATMPENLTWEITPSGYAYATDTLLWATETPYMGLTLTLNGPASPTGAPGSVLASSVFDIVKHASSINIIQTAYSFTVKKDDVDAMAAFMTAGVSYKLNPEDATDAVSWEKDDENNILEWNETVGCYTPKAGGTAKIRPYITKKDGSKLYPANNAWITVTVVVPVERIDIDYSLFDGQFIANVGDSHLYERLERLVSIYPLDATDKSYSISVDNSGSVKLTGNKTLTAERAGRATVTLTAHGADATAMVTNTVNILVVDPTTAVTFQTNLLDICLTDGNTLDITEAVKNNVTMNGSWIRGNSGTVTLSGTSVTCDNPTFDDSGLGGNWMAVKTGETTVTISIQWPNYDAWGVDNNDVLTYKTSQSAFQINVSNNVTLSRFNVAVTNAVAGQTGTITLTPQPAGATFQVSDIGVTIDNGFEGDWGAQLTVRKKSLTSSALVFEYSSTIPCMVNVSTAFVTGERIPINDPLSSTPNSFTGFEIGYALNLAEGWQWRSNPCGFITPSDFTPIFTDNLEEIRTSNNLLYNDPTWGFFGTLNNTVGILQGQCYKIKMKNEQQSMLYGSSVTDNSFIDGTLNTDRSTTITLKPGWNWVGSPYLFNRKLNNIFAAQANELAGFVIVGKESSAELSNQLWEGNLTALQAGEGYIIYNPTDARVNMIFPSEFNMTPGNEIEPAGVKSSTVWDYDHTRFMNNMTMVANVEDVDNPEQYSIGAFVGDECRGEGTVMNGKAFITVHCNPGEYVTFKLYNAYTGKYQIIEEGLKAQTRVGSLKAPFKLHAGALVDGINGIASGSGRSSEAYDLSGRRMSSQQRGVSIRRMADGQSHKVIVK